MHHSRLLCSLAAFVTACGSSNPSQPLPDGAPPIVDGAIDTPPDAEVGPTCPSPFTVTPDAGAQAAATTALAALDPGATLTWADARGTFASIDGLVIQLPACTGSTDAYDQLFDVLAQSPALFQIDRTEWSVSSLPCAEILAEGFHTLVLHRTGYGPFALQTDVFSVVADVQAGRVILRNFSGVYLPPPSTSLLDLLNRCERVAGIPDKLRTQPFAYQVFAAPPADTCSAESIGHYTLAAADTLTIDPAIKLRWEDNTPVQVFPESVATALVDAANQTPALLRSDANCADDNGDPSVGWTRTFDAFTGVVLYDHASPDPFCTVCLRE